MNTEWLAELWQFRELFYFFAWRDVRIRYKQTMLGAAWAIIQPLFTMIIFLQLFGRLAKIPTDNTPPALFYYTALVPWVYFSVTLGMCSNSLISNAGLLTKVYFPRCILPISAALSGLVDFLIGSLMLGALMAYYRIVPTRQLLLWPFLTILLAAFTSGLGMLFAAASVKYRDVKYAVPFAIQLGLFVTPVIYPTSLLPERYRHWLQLNPLTGIIDSFRATVAPEIRIPWGSLMISIGVTILTLLVGIAYFQRTERAFADVI